MPDVLGFPKRLPTSMNSKLPQAKFSLPRTWYLFLSILTGFFACMAGVRPRVCEFQRLFNDFRTTIIFWGDFGES